jgi:hypothetical protein
LRRRVSWLVVPFCCALACSGRFEHNVDGGGDGGVSTGQGGSGQSPAGTSRGGSGPPGAGGKLATAGATMGGASTTGGASTIGGAVGRSGSSGSGGACSCAPIQCVPGYAPVPDVAGCCFHCAPDCAMQHKAYEAFSQQLIVKYSSLGCDAPADCGLYVETNACGSLCGIPVLRAYWKEVDSALRSYAQMACDPTCPAMLDPSCDVSGTGGAGGDSGQVPDCFKGSCF